jgi:hypothetical protein
MTVVSLAKTLSLLFVFSIVCNIGLVCNEGQKIILERPNVERFEKIFSRYGKVVKLNKTKKIIWYGLLGLGVLGGGGYLLYKAFFSPDDNSNSGSDSSSSKSNSGGNSNNNNTFFKKFREALLSTLAFSFSAILLDTMYSTFIGVGSVAKAFFYNGNEKLSDLVVLTTSISNTLRRLQSSMRELHTSDRTQWLGKHYVAEIISSQKIFVHSLESICAILLWKAQNARKNKEVILSDCSSFIMRLFFFCNQVALAIERDFQNEKWSGFSQETFGLVAMLEKVLISFIRDNTTRQA